MRRVLDPHLMGHKGRVLLGLGKFFCWASFGSVGLAVGRQWLVHLLLIKSSAIEGMAAIWLSGVVLSWRETLVTWGISARVLCWVSEGTGHWRWWVWGGA